MNFAELFTPNFMVILVFTLIYVFECRNIGKVYCTFAPLWCRLKPRAGAQNAPRFREKENITESAVLRIIKLAVLAKKALHKTQLKKAIRRLRKGTTPNG